jgi:hypothetical protein
MFSMAAIALAGLVAGGATYDAYNGWKGPRTGLR